MIVGGLCMGAILGLHLAARHPDKVQGVSLFSPTLWINGWAMPWYLRLFSLVRSSRFAKLFNFPDAQSLGIKCPRVRGFVKAAFESDGSDYGRSGTPGDDGSRAPAHGQPRPCRSSAACSQPTLIVHSRQDDYADLNNAELHQGRARPAASTWWCWRTATTW